MLSESMRDQGAELGLGFVVEGGLRLQPLDALLDGLLTQFPNASPEILEESGFVPGQGLGREFLQRVDLRVFAERLQQRAGTEAGTVQGELNQFDEQRDTGLIERLDPVQMFDLGGQQRSSQQQAYGCAH